MRQALSEMVVVGFRLFGESSLARLKQNFKIQEVNVKKEKEKHVWLVGLVCDYYLWRSTKA